MSTITAPSRDIEQVKAEFDAWRKRRVGRERIPEYLWAAAIELLNYYPIATVQKQLLLNLNQLKRRSVNIQLEKQSLLKQQFLEIKPAEVAAINGPQYSANNNYNPQMSSARPGAEPVCRIAFERSDGSRLTISLPADANMITVICTNLLRE